MHEPDRPIKKADGGIAWAESDRLLLKWDYLLYRPGVELAPAETGECDHRVAIQRERRSAGQMPAPADSLIPMITRTVSAAANRLCASTDCGSSARARSNRLMAC